MHIGHVSCNCGRVGARWQQGGAFMVSRPWPGYVGEKNSKGFILLGLNKRNANILRCQGDLNGRRIDTLVYKRENKRYKKIKEGS